MKFVYVIVGSEDNFFLEQSLISIYTLRKHNPHAYISLLIDDGTAKLITKYKSPILSYTNEILTPTLPNGLLPIQKSRFLKTSQRKLLRGKLLYIDNDTFITGSLKELEDLDYDIAAVANKHGYYDKLGSHPMNKHYQKVTGISPEKDLKIRNFVNNGVIFSSDTDLALDFFDMWHYLWWKTSSEKGFHKDQIEIWHTNVIKGNILKKLNDNYNCQLVYPKECLPYLPTAKIFHYFSSTDHISHLTLKNKLFLYEEQGEMGFK